MSDRRARTVVFVVTGRADADHLAPVIHSLASAGDRVRVVTTSPEAHRALTSMWWWDESTAVGVTRVAARRRGLLGRLRNLRWNRPILRAWLRRIGASLVVREWGEGVGAVGLPVPTRVARYWATDFPVQVLLAARDLGVATVALPHGHSVKTVLVPNRHVVEKMRENGGKLPFADRDSYAAYVFCSDYHRDAILGSSSMSGRNAQVWGSARFNDAWVPALYDGTVPAELPDPAPGGSRRVLFFLPKWQNLIDRPATLRLLAALAGDGRMQVVVRGHVRSEAASIDEAERAALRGDRVVLVPDDVPSAALIKACDVVVDVDSSIAFDAVLIGKPYVRPRYLQDGSIETVWDRLGGAHQTSSEEETVELLARDDLGPAPRDPRFDTVVFGGPGVAVLGRYRTELRRLAGLAG